MGWHWRDVYRLDEKRAWRSAMRDLHAEAIKANEELDRRNSLRLTMEEAWGEAMDMAHQLAICEDWSREQNLRAQALVAAWEASNHLPTLMEFISEAPVGSTVLGPQERKLIVEDHGWYRVVDKQGLTNVKTMLSSVAYGALMDGRIES